MKRKTASYLDGTIIEINGEGELEPRNTQLSISKLSGSIEEQIQLMLDEEVNQILASNGGNVMFEGIRDSTASVRLVGGCQVVSFTHLRAPETRANLLCGLRLEKKKQ